MTRIVAAGLVRKTKVAGIPVIVETNPFFESVSFGILIDAGSRDEDSATAGLFHFIEHLVFKGTPTRNQRTIAVEIDRLGGRIDAYTTRETTSFTGRVVKERLPEAFALVADLLLASTFPADEIERERTVIFEEIGSAEDNPSDFIQDRMYPALWPNHPLGRLITGDIATVSAITRDDLIAAQQRFYRPPRLVVTACGGVDLETMAALVDRHFGALSPDRAGRPDDLPIPAQTVAFYDKQIEQTHLMIAFPSPPFRDPRRADLDTIDAILGGGISSRLFQKVREELGLAYSVSSYYEQYQEAGLMAIYAACSPYKLGILYEVIREEVATLMATPPTDEEVSRSVSMGKEAVRLAYESPGSRVYDMGEEQLSLGAPQSREEALAELDAVTPETVHALAKEVFAGAGARIVIGPAPSDARRVIEG